MFRITHNIALLRGLLHACVPDPFIIVSYTKHKEPMKVGLLYYVHAFYYLKLN